MLEAHVNTISQFLLQHCLAQAGFVLLSEASETASSHQFNFCTLLCFLPSEKALSIFLGSNLFCISKLTIKLSSLPDLGSFYHHLFYPRGLFLPWFSLLVVVKLDVVSNHMEHPGVVILVILAYKTLLGLGLTWETLQFLMQEILSICIWVSSNNWKEFFAVPIYRWNVPEIQSFYFK